MSVVEKQTSNDIEGEILKSKPFIMYVKKYFFSYMSFCFVSMPTDLVLKKKKKANHSLEFN